MIYLGRSELMESLESAAQKGSLLVIGEPGSGKSWLLNEFVARRSEAGDGAILLRAEDHAAGSLEELQRSIGTKDFVAALRSYPGTRHYLVIDSLDALRAELAQRAFRDLIRVVHQELRGWTVIASMRTFDARQSVEFQHLFPARGDAIPSSLHIPARNLLVPLFSDNEMQDAAKQDVRLSPVLEHASADARILLRNAYNLWLVIHLLNAGVSADWLSSVQSDVQLLQRYWQHRVESGTDAGGAKRILLALVQRMVASNSLSVAWRDLDSADLSPDKVFQTLLSNEVLRRSETERVSFGHNILFDFAVSRLLLDEESLVPFLQENPVRSIFYRPSVSYFFARLWFSDRSTFWSSFTNLFRKENLLPARSLVTPAVVLYESAQRLEDLSPLKQIKTERGSVATLYVLRAVQAFNGLDSRKRILWAGFLANLSNELDLVFVNEYVGLLETAIDYVPSQRAQLAFAATRLLHWMWQWVASESPQISTESLASLAAGRVIPIVAKLYAAAPQEVRATLAEVLDRLGNPKASASEAYSLASNIDSIIRTEPSFATEIYERVFRHEESSEKETRMGTGVVLALTSTRKQDFGMAYYILAVKYPQLLSKDLFEAARAAVGSATAEVERLEGDTINKLSLYDLTIEIAGVQSRFRSDRSEIWDHGYRENEGLGIFNQLLHLLPSQLTAGVLSQEDMRNVIRIIAEKTLYAVIWKRVLEFAALTPSLLSELYPLLKNPEVLAAPETTVAAGKAISAVFEKQLFSEAERQSIEQAILSIPSSSMAETYKDPSKIRDRLLACIPESDLGPLGKDIIGKLKELKSVPSNEPFVRFGPAGYGPVTDDMWLREQGVDPERPENQVLLKAELPIKQFSSQFVNENPSAEECESVERDLLAAYQAIEGNTNADVSVVTQVFTTVASVAQAILKNDNLNSNSSVVTLARKIVIKAAGYPHPGVSEKADEQFDQPMWGPTPKIEAAQGVMNYIWVYGIDDEILETFQLLTRDPSPAVRFQVVARLLSVYKHDRDLFWKTATEMGSKERATGVLGTLTSTVVHGYVVQRERAKVIKWLSELLRGPLPEQRPEDVLEVAVNSLTELWVYFGDEEAKLLLDSFREEPSGHTREMSQMILTASHYVGWGLEGPSEEPIVRSRAQSVMLDVIRIVDRHFRNLSAGPVPVSDAESRERGELFKKLLGVLDSAAFRLYLALDVNRDLRRDDVRTLGGKAKRTLFLELRPVWEQLAETSTPPKRRPLAASTTHYLMEIFSTYLSTEPSLVLELAASLLSGHNLGYQFDSMAISEVVKFAREMLADHKEMLRTSENATRLGSILDVFVSVGWPQATQLVMQLDSVVR